MGRRSINTTKSGKYMNPTDQARKEARKKELKKNKKQRQMVRAAVLKGKDPLQLLVDLEKIDQMEYNVLQPSPLNEKVLKDKRKKLKDTLDRVLKMYNKDDPEKWVELKRAQVEYDRKRTALLNYYEAVKNAQQVQIDEIPLPINALTPEIQAAFRAMPSQIPLPPQMVHMIRPHFAPPHGILKKNTAYIGPDGDKRPPGIPPGPPPDLMEFDIPIVTGHIVSATQSSSNLLKKSIRFADEEAMSIDAALAAQQPEVPGVGVEDDEEAGGSEEAVVQTDQDEDLRPTSLQKKMLAMAGQDINHFMKEMEEANKKRRAERAADLDARLQALDSSAPPSQLMNVMPGLGPMMFRPPPRGVPSLMGIRLPPGPPPRMGMSLPPGPPPGLPPRMMRPPHIHPSGPPSNQGPPPPSGQSNVLSAAPQLIHRPEPSGPTIQAQAQIRNLSADITRFLPTALRVKRDEKHKPRAKPITIHEPKVEVHHPVLKPGQTKDDAYQQFMREMQGLL